MILNVSGRTDIVAFYSKWFLNRYKEGYVDVRNPFYKKQVSRIYFDDVDAIVFCTKNPIPILEHLKSIKQPILFHVTLTPYKEDIEPNVPPKGKIIEAIKKLSKIIDQNCIYIRYDPIFINEKYNLEYHIRSFDHLCNELNGFVKHIIISFLDDYKNVRRNYSYLKPKELTENDYREIGIHFSNSAMKNGMTVQTCCEEHYLVEYGFQKEDCISATLAYKLTNKTNFKLWKARGKQCNCIEMVDIGVYNTCKHLCKYCYANYQEENVLENIKKHNPTSSLLIGCIEKDDIIKRRS